MNTANELLDSLKALLSSDDHVDVVFDDDVGMWGVWLDGDIIGSAQNRTEAIDAALAQVRRWNP
jgi:hypothetical protein